VAAAHPAPPPPGRIDPLASLLARVAYRLNRETEAILNRSGLTLEQWRVLDLLADRNGRPMSEIAAHVMVPPPTLTKIVDRLVDNALVHRRVDETDRRRVLVLATDRGIDLHEQLIPAVTRVELDLTVELGQHETTQLVQLLSRITTR
jgi:MarR family transcriptional regulator, organic hydroperoxide resistance regulator